MVQAYETATGAKRNPLGPYDIDVVCVVDITSGMSFALFASGPDSLERNRSVTEHFRSKQGRRCQRGKNNESCPSRSPTEVDDKGLQVIDTSITTDSSAFLQATSSRHSSFRIVESTIKRRAAE